jgi:hypothetical protein
MTEATRNVRIGVLGAARINRSALIAPRVAPTAST